MQNTDVISSVPVLAHVACALLLALSLQFLSRLFGRPYLRRWALAWACLAAAMLAGRAQVATPGGRGFWIVYLVAEWYFLAALWVGCREMARGGGDSPRLPQLLLTGLPAAIILAGALVPFFPDFNALFSIQAAVLAIGCGIAFAALGQTPRARRGFGFLLMRGALGWLVVQFALYVPLYLAAGGPGRSSPAAAGASWLGYAPLAAFCAELLLGFGMLLAAAEQTQRELEARARSAPSPL